jgi:hypothetical protein
MKPHTVVLVLCPLLVLLTACDPQDGESSDTPFRQASTMRQSLSCPLPSGTARFAPIRMIAPGDHTRQRLARELVELRRRQLQTSWISAAQYLNQDQATLVDQQQQMQQDLARIDNLLQVYVTREYAFNDEANEYINSMADQYRHQCDTYRQIDRKLQALQEELPQLRKERKQPWLAASRRLTCSMQNQPGCFPD